MNGSGIHWLVHLPAHLHMVVDGRRRVCGLARIGAWWHRRRCSLVRDGSAGTKWRVGRDRTLRTDMVAASLGRGGTSALGRGGMAAAPRERFVCGVLTADRSRWCC